MSFGIYVHIPYCLQRCTYCDFATYEQSRILPPDQYVDLVEKEISWLAGSQKSPLSNRIPDRKVSTIYFGGGTPSLVAPILLKRILNSIRKNGFLIGADTELTLEINPATLNRSKIKEYLDLGFNRFSVGAQTFDDGLLKKVHREHNSQDTHDTLTLLKENTINYSFDLLFALPGQTLEMLKKDLDVIEQYRPPHISPYCLTIPEGHVLEKGRPLDDEQVKMFDLIHRRLSKMGYSRYEISNYALPGFESRHNSLYWDDESYWGVGLSSHSYFNKIDGGQWGVRFWNPKTIEAYTKWVQNLEDFETDGKNPQAFHLPTDNHEFLKRHQSLTDFCHTSLRRKAGLNLKVLESKFGPQAKAHVEPLLKFCAEQDWLYQNDTQSWTLTDEGVIISNQVFAQLTFLEEESHLL